MPPDSPPIRKEVNAMRNDYELKITWVGDRIDRIEVVYKDGYREVFQR